MTALCHIFLSWVLLVVSFLYISPVVISYYHQYAIKNWSKTEATVLTADLVRETKVGGQYQRTVEYKKITATYTYNIDGIRYVGKGIAPFETMNLEMNTAIVNYLNEAKQTETAVTIYYNPDKPEISYLFKDIESPGF